MKDRPHILAVAASSARRAWLSGLAQKALGRDRITVATSAVSWRGGAQQVSAEVLLIDLDSPAAAASLIETLREAPGSLSCVALFDDPDPRWVVSALEAGVSAVLSRDINFEELQLAVAAADAGLILLHPTSVRDLTATVLQPRPYEDDVEQLTPREREVLRLMSDGLGNKEIAARLAISEHTAKFHISSILGKLSAASRTEAVRQGIKRGLIPI